MDDIVNKFFRKHYPPDYATAWEMEAGITDFWRRYTGRARWRSAIFPHVICADGFEMSVQGHCGAYSRPQDDFAEHYSHVEIMAHEHIPEFDDASCDTCRPEYWLWRYVPVDIVCKVIEKHGGLKS